MSLWITCKNMQNKRKIRNGKRAGKMFDFPSEESWSIHIQAIKGRHMGQGCQAAIGTSLPPAPLSATLRYGENPTRHTQRVLRSFDGCHSHLLFYVPQTSRVKRSSAWHCTCVLLRRDGGCRAACVAKVGKGIGRCSETCGQYHPEPAGFSCECKTY